MHLVEDLEAVAVIERLVPDARRLQIRRHALFVATTQHVGKQCRPLAFAAVVRVGADEGKVVVRLALGLMASHHEACVSRVLLAAARRGFREIGTEDNRAKEMT